MPYWGLGAFAGTLVQLLSTLHVTVLQKDGFFQPSILCHLALELLCVARVILTTKAAFDINIIVDVLPEAIQVLIPYLSIHLNDLVVIAIWVLIPILCGRSITGLWGFLGMTSLHRLFFMAFFTDKVNLLRLVPILTILLTGASAMYIPRLVWFIYTQWTYELAYLVQTLQIYPALLMVVQTLYQGIFLLQAYGNPHFIEDVARKNFHGCKKMLTDHIMLNVTLLVHCVCIGTVVGMLDFEQKRLIMSLAVGEVVYRLFAVVAFVYLKKKVETFGTSNNLADTPRNEAAITEDANIDSSEYSMAQCETGYDGSREKMVTGRHQKLSPKTVPDCELAVPEQAKCDEANNSSVFAFNCVDTNCKTYQKVASPSFSLLAGRNLLANETIPVQN